MFHYQIVELSIKHLGDKQRLHTYFKQNLDLLCKRKISYIFLLITSYNKLYLKAPSKLQHKIYHKSWKPTSKNNHPPQNPTMDRNIFAWIHVENRKNPIARDQSSILEQLLMIDRSPTTIILNQNKQTTSCHLSQCCTAYMCARPKLIAFLICVYVWKTNKNP